MPIEQQKTINYGGKHSGKILGGMYFIENEAVTDVGAGNTFVRIGAGGAMGLVPFTLYQTNQYFEIVGTTVQTQTLRMKMGVPAELYLDWQVCVTNTGVEGQINLAFRIRKIIALTSSTETVSSSQITGRTTPNGTGIGDKILISLAINDQLYIELSNIDGTQPTRDIVVTSARLIVSE